MPTVTYWTHTATPIAHFAATELRDYLHKLTGLAIPIQQIEPPTATPPAGLILTTGDLPPRPAWLATAATITAGLRDDGFAIRSLGDAAILAGANERGTLYAVYAFLEHLGVRFFAPNFPFYEGHAEHVPTLPTFDLPVFDLREEPSFTLRRKYVEEGWSHTPRTLPPLIDWMAKARLNVLVYPYDYQGKGLVRWDTWREALTPELARRGILLEVGGHGYQSFLPRADYEAAHPDWFPPRDAYGAEGSFWTALDGSSRPATGETGGPFVHDGTVFDVLNDAALDTYIANVIAYLRACPEIAIFDAWPPDAAEWPRRVIEHFGGIANAQAYVTRRLAEAVRAALPGVRVESVAYLPAAEPPDPAHGYDDATIIDIAPFDRSHTTPIFSPEHPRNRHYDALIRAWRDSGFRGDLAIYECYRRYAWCSRPVLLPRLIGEEIPYYRSLGATGIGIYSEPADWLTFEITHLLVAALSWDCTLDVETYLRAYLVARYGHAADHVGRYLRYVEDAARLIYDRFRGNFDDPEKVRRARSGYIAASIVLGVALKQATTASATFLLTRLAANLDYAIADIDAHHRHNGDTASAAEAADRALRLAETHWRDGIILLALQVHRRYNLPVTDADLPALYARYRDAW